MDILIIGTGPTGLGAGMQLHSSSHKNHHIFEKNSSPGGLSSSVEDSQRFTWDIGGHVLFSHYPEFDSIVEKALQGEFYQHQRESWIRIDKVWVPYPFQNNIRYLPDETRDSCLKGLQNLSANPTQTTHFKEWIYAIFGEGIVKYFMEPYNFKVWATPLELMAKDWIAERVSIVDLAQIEKNISQELDDIGWGPNSLFKFPKHGGTGAIFNAISDIFIDKISFEHGVSEVDLTNKEVVFTNGQQCSYKTLISTIPLDLLIKCCRNVPDAITVAAKRLTHNSVFVVGIGFKGKRKDSKCWMYFPESNCPFYRVTNFHNYSPYNVPDGNIDKYYSLMCETSYSKYKPAFRNTIIEETIQGLINTGMIKESDRDNIISTHLIDVPYAYPIPTIGRDTALDKIQSFLEANNVFSRGRFGAWKYEIGNMDHSFMQGIEVAERVLNGTKEKVINGH